MTAHTSRDAILAMHAALPDSIARSRKLAQEAIDQYTAEVRNGEPIYPAWADDVLRLCMAAEIYNCEQVLYDHHKAEAGK